VKLHEHIRSDEGFALATVMGAIAVITALAFGGFFVAESTLAESTRVTSENRAYQAASSGLERELAVFKPEFLATGQSPNGYEYGTEYAINGQDAYVVNIYTSATDPSLGADQYKIVSTGHSRGTSETVSVEFQSFNLWDMNISGSENSDMGAGEGFNGNGTIIGKVYCNGDFDWSGNGALVGGPLFVRNGVFNKASVGSNVGFADDHVAGYLDNPPTGQTSNMYVDLEGTAPKLVIPWPVESDMDVWRDMALDYSNANRLGDDTGTDGVVRHPSSRSDDEYNVFDGDLTLSSAVPFGKSTPSYVTKDADGTVNEAASADVIAVSGSTLHVNGVIYVDGTVTIDSSINTYVGKGLIVARQGVVINGGLVPAVYDSGTYEVYDTQHMPLTSTMDCIGFASLGDVTQNVADWVCGAVFTSGAYIAPNTSCKFRGSIIAQRIDFGQPNAWLATQTGMSANLPPGLPPLNNLNAMGDWVRQ
jgi:Tfp pilus assembly protein PilX